MQVQKSTNAVVLRRVYWAEDHEWYDADVVGWDPSKKLHIVW